MYFNIVYAAAGAVSLLILSSVLSMLLKWRRNIATAKATGLPVVVVPLWYMFDPWRLIVPPMMPMLRKILPRRWVSPWIDFISPMHSFEHMYSMFDDMGTDSFWLVSPGTVMLHTADAEVIHQTVMRKSDFPKPLHMYESLNNFGNNVVASEGREWRAHRKIVAPPFSEKNNKLVWQESLFYCQAMLKSWLEQDEKQNNLVDTIGTDTMRFSLHIISSAGFGQRMTWPGQEKKDDNMADASDVLKNGHKITYTEAIRRLLDDFLFIAVFPPQRLKYVPFKRARAAYDAYDEWGRYMQELIDLRRAGIKQTENDTTDLLESMVRADEIESKNAVAGSFRPSILGNSFLLLLAGHETTAHALYDLFLFLAMNPWVQRDVQKEIDEISGGKGSDEWEYETYFPRFFGGLVGASVNETLRLRPPVLEIPKYTYTPQHLTISTREGAGIDYSRTPVSFSRFGEKAPPSKPFPRDANPPLEKRDILIPPHTVVYMDGGAVHRNPRFWPHAAPRDPANPEHPYSNLDNDLEEFKPHRWLPSFKGAPTSPVNPTGTAAATAAATASGNEKGSGDADEDRDTFSPADEGATTATSLYTPPPGAYLPFSAGFRQCIGRRFAQVELTAVLALLLASCSVELDVKESEEQDGEAGKVKRWWTERERVKRHMRDGAMYAITVGFKPGWEVNLRFVSRGEERFGDIQG